MRTYIVLPWRGCLVLLIGCYVVTISSRYCPPFVQGARTDREFLALTRLDPLHDMQSDCMVYGGKDSQAQGLGTRWLATRACLIEPRLRLPRSTVRVAGAIVPMADGCRILAHAGTSHLRQRLVVLGRLGVRSWSSTRCFRAVH